jgi:MFS transporter, DHA3 family, macrolide efflux protein
MSQDSPASPRFRTFAIIWATQSLSELGNALGAFALIIWLTQTLYPRPDQQPQLAFALSADALAGALPLILTAPFAGNWADHHDRRRTMLAMDLASGSLSLILVFLLASGTLQLWMLLIFTALFSVFGTFHYTAFDTSYIMLVPDRLLPRANGMMQTSLFLTGIIGPALAAFLIAVPQLARQNSLPLGILAGFNDGTALAMIFNTVSFIIAAVALMLVYIPNPKKAGEPNLQTGKVWANFKEGAVYIWRRRPLLMLQCMSSSVNFVIAPLSVFLPLLVKFNLKDDWNSKGFTFETALALINSGIGLGGVVGGIFITLWGGFKTRRIYGYMLPIIIICLAQITIGLSPLIFLTAGMTFVLGLALPTSNAHGQAIWQRQVAPELQGRVFAVRRMIGRGTAPISLALAGWLAGIFDPGLLMVALNVPLLIVFLVQLINPYVLKVEDKEWLEQQANRYADQSAKSEA